MHIDYISAAINITGPEHQTLRELLDRNPMNGVIRRISKHGDTENEFPAIEPSDSGHIRAKDITTEAGERFITIHGSPAYLGITPHNEGKWEITDDVDPIFGSGPSAQLNVGASLALMCADFQVGNQTLLQQLGTPETIIRRIDVAQNFHVGYEKAVDIFLENCRRIPYRSQPPASYINGTTWGHGSRTASMTIYGKGRRAANRQAMGSYTYQHPGEHLILMQGLMRAELRLGPRWCRKASEMHNVTTRLLDVVTDLSALSSTALIHAFQSKMEPIMTTAETLHDCDVTFEEAKSMIEKAYTDPDGRKHPRTIAAAVAFYNTIDGLGWQRARLRALSDQVFMRWTRKLENECGLTHIRTIQSSTVASVKNLEIPETLPRPVLVNSWEEVREKVKNASAGETAAA